MPAVTEIASLADVLCFVVWNFAVLGLGKALFGSFPMQELTYRLSARWQARQRMANVLTWELRHREEYSPEAVANSPHAARRPLSPVEIRERERRLDRLVRVTVWERMWRYFMSCVFCQTFWAGVLAYGLVRGVTGWNDVVAMMATALAWAALGARILAFGGSMQQAGGEKAKTRPDCPHC